MKTKTIIQQLKNVMMVYKTKWFNNVAGIKVRIVSQSKSYDIYFYFVLLLNFRYSKFLFVTGDAPANKMNEGMSCGNQCYQFFVENKM